MSKAENVILVHGAWADGSSWSKVIPLLLERGLGVTAVQLPLTSLKNDVATVKRALALEEGPIVLVGHSYGGVVITEAGNDPKSPTLFTSPPSRPTWANPSILLVPVPNLRPWDRRSAPMQQVF
jgi:alpha-beta hydrolase superfamily lysophospholipase